MRHSTLTEHARCLYGDEYRPTRARGQEHREHYFVEELTFADADVILSMLRELCPNLADGQLPVWIRNLAYRLVLLQRPDEPALLREAAQNLRLHARTGTTSRPSSRSGRKSWTPADETGCRALSHSQIEATVTVQATMSAPAASRGWGAGHTGRRRDAERWHRHVVDSEAGCDDPARHGAW